jgi:dynein heavy chain
MIILKTIRPDRVLFSATQFILEKIGEYYTNPPSMQMEKIFEDSTKTIPVIFILAPGVDPFP